MTLSGNGVGMTPNWLTLLSAQHLDRDTLIGVPVPSIYRTDLLLSMPMSARFFDSSLKLAPVREHQLNTAAVDR